MRYYLFFFCWWVTIVAVAETPPELALNAALRLALTQNLNLQTAHERVISAQITVETAQAAFHVHVQPEIAGRFQEGGTANQQIGVRVSKKLTTGGEFDWQTRFQRTAEEDQPYQTTLTLGYTQPLLKGRGTLAATAEVVSAERQLSSQERAFTLAQQQLMMQVATAYYGILRDQLLLEVNQSALTRAQTLLQATEAKLKVGMASKMDVFRAELQALTAENGLVDAQTSLEQTKGQFNLLIGAEFTAEFVFSTPLDYVSIELNPDELVQSALTQRLELQDAYENINEAERRLTLARQNQYPPIDVSVQYTLTGKGEALNDSFDLQDGRWGVGFSSALDFNFAQAQAAYQQAQFAYNGALRALQAQEQAIMLEVLQTIASVRQAQARVGLQEQSVVQAEQQLALAELRYKKGLSDNLDVIDAEEAVVTARSGYYAAVMQHLLAKMKLYQVTGSLAAPL